MLPNRAEGSGNARVGRQNQSAPPVSEQDVRDALPDLLNASPTAFAALDGEWRFAYANREFELLLGHDSGTLVGREFLAGFDAEEQDAFAATGDAWDGEGQCGWTTVHRDAAGNERVLEYIARRHQWHGRVVVALAVRDVSETRRAVRTAAGLAKVAASMAFAGSLRATLDSVARSVVEATGIPACLVWHIEGDEQRLQVAGSHGLPLGFAEILEQAWRDGADLPSLRAFRDRKPLVIPQARVRLLTEPAYAPLREHLLGVRWQSLACVPLMYRGAALGTLVGYYPQDDGPGGADLAFLSAVADQAAVAVESARLAIQARASAAAAERTQAEALLQEKEMQYRAIFDITTDGLIVTTMDGIDVEANPAYCRMHGYTLDELRHLPANAYIHPDHYHVLDGYLRTVRAGGIFHARSMHLRKDGTAFHVEVHGTPFTYHGEPHVLGVVRDVTEQVQAYQMLERRVEERTRELSLLLEVSHNMASTLELEPLLGLILAQLKEVVDYLDANVLKLDGGDLIVLGYWGTFDASAMIGRRFAVANASANRRVIERREPVIIADIWDDSPLAESFRKVGMADLDNSHAHIGSWMGVPLMQKEQVIGMLGLGHVQPHYYTPRHARLALAIATQAAVAIENARLYSAAQEIAALRERQRLARDLHDSVSQALYGISLGAHTARTLLEREPARAAQPIDYVLTLAEAGLAEMRALIFELRPESLQAEGLVAAINHQLAALSARHGIGVEASLGEEPDVPLGVKEAIYRILQEALHNTVKHARAANVRIALGGNASGLEAEVQDDGIGFDANGDFPGHLGLQSMKERAAGFGGTLRVESAPGKGTKVHAWVPRRG